MTRIELRLNELRLEAAALVETTKGQNPKNKPYQKAQKKMNKIRTAILYLEKGPTEEFIKQEIENLHKKGNTRTDAVEDLDKQRQHLSEKDYKQKLETLSLVDIKHQIAFLRFCLPKD